MSSPKETPGKTIAPQIAKKDLLEVNLVVVYKMCYSSKDSFFSKTCLIESIFYQNLVFFTRIGIGCVVCLTVKKSCNPAELDVCRCTDFFLAHIVNLYRKLYGIKYENLLYFFIHILSSQ